MKKKLIVLTAIGLGSLTYINIKNVSINTEVLNVNTEALADGESISGYVDCAGSGSIYCPIDQKAEYREVHIYQ